MSPLGHDPRFRADGYVSTVMHVTSLNYPRHLALLVVFASYSILYFRTTIRRLGGWDLRVTWVSYPPRSTCRAPRFREHVLSSDPPCKIEEVPAVDAIILSVCPHLFAPHGSR